MTTPISLGSSLDEKLKHAVSVPVSLTVKATNTLGRTSSFKVHTTLKGSKG